MTSGRRVDDSRYCRTAISHRLGFKCTPASSVIIDVADRLQAGALHCAVAPVLSTRSTSPLGVSGLLRDTPDPAIKVLLDCLQPRDFAGLRRVSHLISDRTTKHLPAIQLRLYPSTTKQQVQQWFQATYKMQHVPDLKVFCCGSIEQNAADAALELLSQRTGVRELYLTGSNGDELCYIHRLRLNPRLTARLQVLVIADIACGDLADDLVQLAAAATAAGDCQLKTLTLQCPVWKFESAYGWSTFCANVNRLAQALPPGLEKFVLQIPDMSFSSADRKAAAQMADADHGADGGVMKQLEAVAVVAAVANAVLQLGNLKSLELACMPDIWQHDAGEEGVVPPYTQVMKAPTAVMRAAATPTNVAAPIDAIMTGAALSSVRAAAAEFATAEDCGRWLLQHHSGMNVLSIGTTSLWCLTWQLLQQQLEQKQQPASVGFENISNSARSTDALNSAVHFDDVYCNLKVRSDVDNSKSPETALYAQFQGQLSDYSTQPAAKLLSRITKCRLDIHCHQVAELAAVLGDLGSLEVLEIVVSQEEDGAAKDATAAAVVFTAAATVQKLRQLSVCLLDGEYSMPDDALLPLTAAAGGPGSCLTSLSLIGQFKSSSASADDSCVWLEPLGHQRSLQDLQNHSGTLLSLPVARLPSSLQSFAGENLRICSTAGLLAMPDKG